MIKAMNAFSLACVALSFVGMIYLGAISIRDHERLAAWGAQFDAWHQCHVDHPLWDGCEQLAPKS